MNLVQAVNQRLILSFTYDGLSRRVQPATYGATRTGKTSLRGCLIAGASQRNSIPCWELYTVSKMQNVTSTGETFTEFAVSGYTTNDSAFISILAEH
jgi:hypothetical protein